MEQPTAETLERIADAQWNGSGKGIVFSDIYQHNACNHTLSGTIDIDGKVYGFVIDSGDWNGTVVKEWGDSEDVGVYEPPQPAEPLTFIPSDINLFFNRPAMFAVYAMWRKEEWFKQKESAYAYDRHFQPGGCIEKHYADFAQRRGMKIGCLSDLPKEAQALLK